MAGWGGRGRRTVDDGELGAPDKGAELLLARNFGGAGHGGGNLGVWWGEVWWGDVMVVRFGA